MRLLPFSFTIYALFLLQYVSPYTITGNTLTDLMANNHSFVTEVAVSGWTASSYYSVPGLVHSACFDTYLVGGFEVLGPYGGSTFGQDFHTTYSGLPGHNQISFSFEFWAIDEWLSAQNDNILIHFGGQTFSGWKFDHLTTSFAPNMCGVNDKIDLPGVIIEGTVSHIGPSIEFKIESQLHQSSYYQSFGIREITLIFENVGTPTNSICARSPTILPDARKCACVPGRFENPVGSGNCVQCHTSCGTCNGPYTTSCTSCKEGFWLSGNQCLPCNVACAACSTSATTCTNCHPGEFLSGNTCQICSSICETCGTSATDCLTCPDDRYKSGNTCLLCDSSCATCSGAGSNQCLACDSTDFLVNNNTCIDTCDLPLIVSTDGTNKFCDSPCLGGYLFWDGSCSADCLAPFTPEKIGGLLDVCENTCPGSDYLYWNGSCEAQCNSPYQATLYKGRKYCDYPCDSYSFLYWNGSCKSTCPLPLMTRVEGGKGYCDNPCTSTQYLFWNSSCETTCPAPLKIIQNGGVSYCEFPCSHIEFAYFNGSCSENCTSSLSSRTEGFGANRRKFCDLICDPDEYMLWNGECSKKVCEAPLRNSTWNGKAYCLGPCDAGAPYYFEDIEKCGKSCNSPRWLSDEDKYPKCMLSLAEDRGGDLIYYLLNAPLKRRESTLVVLTTNMEYLRYLDCKMPSRLLKMAKSSGRGFISLKFGFEMPGSMRKHFEKENIPDIFETYNLHSSFFVNFWEDLITILIFLFIVVIFAILEKLLRKATKWQTFHRMVERILIMMRFNIVLMIFAIYGPDIILFTSLQLRSNTFDSIWSAISMVFGIFMLLLTVALFGVIFWLVNQATRNGGYFQEDKDKESYYKFIVKWRAAQVLIRGFNHNNIYNKLFFLIYLFRINLPIFIAAWFEGHPIIQIVAQLIINAAILIFIVMKKPLQQKVNQIQLVLIESILIMLNLCVFMLVVFDESDAKLEDLSIVLGDIIILGNDLINALLIVFLLIKCKMEVDNYTYILKESVGRGNEIWVQLVVLPFQQACLGFEQIFDDACINTEAGYTGMTSSARVPVRAKSWNLNRNSRIYPESMMSPNLLADRSVSPSENVSFSQLDFVSESSKKESISPISNNFKINRSLTALRFRKQGTLEGQFMHNPLPSSPAISLDMNTIQTPANEQLSSIKREELLHDETATSLTRRSLMRKAVRSKIMKHSTSQKEDIPSESL